MSRSIPNNIEVLFKAYYRPLCMFSIHIVDDVDAAEDIVMGCFTKYVEKVGDGDVEGTTSVVLNPKSYLYQMVRNDSLLYIKCKTDNHNIEDLSEILDDSDELSERTEREVRLWTAIDNLPKIRREVFLMSKREGMKYKEIAEKMGISIKTVEAHISKAYAALREKESEIIK